MCGILFARRRDGRPVKKMLLKRYNRQRTRGTQGFGVLGIKDGKIGEIHRFEAEKDAEGAVRSMEESEILFHHRLPTSTPNYADMTHPIVVKNDSLEHDYYVIHNGVIRNEDTLRKKHLELGFEYTTDMQEISMVKTKRGKVKEDVKHKFNDSESLAIEVARYIDGKSSSIDAVGTIAFICIQTDKEGNVLKLHYGRNAGNPLMVENNGDIFILKSEGDNAESVPTDMLHSIDYKTGKEEVKSIDIGRTGYTQSSSYSSASRAGFGRDDDHDSFRSSNTSPGRVAGLLGDSAPRLSPIQRDRNGQLDWGEDDLPFGDLPVIQAADYDGDRTAYHNSEEYLLDLYEEIGSLEMDIRKCKENMHNPNVNFEDSIYNEEYLSECEYNLSERKVEATLLEDKLASQGR